MNLLQRFKWLLWLHEVHFTSSSRFWKFMYFQFNGLNEIQSVLVSNKNGSSAEFISQGSIAKLSKVKHETFEMVHYLFR